jgi:starch phosphorylase
LPIFLLLHHAHSATLAADIIERLTYSIGKDAKVAKPHDWMTATILVIRDRVIDRWMASTRKTYEDGSKRVYYLSLEFLIGRLTRDAVSNLEMLDEVREALQSLGVDFDAVAALEPDAALGNGGLGRLAACFMESMATVDVPAYGYGIRYVHGLFKQQMSDGWQVELPETWLSHGNPWEFPRHESAYEIGFGGSVDTIGNAESDETQRCIWKPHERMIAVAYDTPVVGWRAKRVNTLRLWTAQPIDPILLDAFNAGDHIGALRESNKAEALARVLYPADQTPAGQELRLRQEYFFSSASLQDILRRHLQQYGDLRTLPDKVAIQLNDTHPAVSVAELMRLLIDVHRMEFDPAWDITRKTFSYTNHTLAARSAGKLARSPVRAVAAAAHAARLRDQRQGLAPGPQGARLRREPDPFGLADRRRWRAPGAHGQPGLYRLTFHQWRLGTPHRPDEADRVFRSA